MPSPIKWRGYINRRDISQGRETDASIKDNYGVCHHRHRDTGGGSKVKMVSIIMPVYIVAMKDVFLQDLRQRRES